MRAGNPKATPQQRAHSKSLLEADRRSREIFSDERRNASARRAESLNTYRTHVGTQKEAKADEQEDLDIAIVKREARNEGAVGFSNVANQGYRGNLNLRDWMTSERRGLLTKKERVYNDLAQRAAFGRPGGQLKAPYLQSLNQTLEDAHDEALRDAEGHLGWGSLYEGGFAKHVRDRAIKGPNGKAIDPMLAAMWYRYRKDRALRDSGASRDDRNKVLNVGRETGRDRFYAPPTRNRPTPAGHAPAFSSENVARRGILGGPAAGIWETIVDMLPDL